MTRVRHFFDKNDSHNWLGSREYAHYDNPTFVEYTVGKTYRLRSGSYKELYATKCGETIKYYTRMRPNEISSGWYKRKNPLRVTQNPDDVECGRCIYGVSGWNTLKIAMPIEMVGVIN